MSDMPPGVLSTRWMKVDELKYYLEIGDVIEIKRQRYEHWVVYIGKELGFPQVIHYSTGAGCDMNDMKTEFQGKCSGGSSPHVRKDILDEVAANDYCRINNESDRTILPFSPIVIIKKAKYELGKTGYTLLTNNCEHFAMWCRYGVHESKQANKVKLLGVGVATFFATASLPITASAVGASYLMLQLYRWKNARSHVKL